MEVELDKHNVTPFFYYVHIITYLQWYWESLQTDLPLCGNSGFGETVFLVASEQYSLMWCTNTTVVLGSSVEEAQQEATHQQLVPTHLGEDVTVLSLNQLLT